MKKIFSLLLCSLMITAVASCSKDDEPEDYTPTFDGVSVYMNALQTFYTSDSQPAFTADPSAEGIYLGQADSGQQAYDFISGVLENSKWGNKDVTVSLGANGEEGKLTVIGASEALLNNGIYNKIIIDINGYTPYTLEIITADKAANYENGYGEDIVIRRVWDNWEE